ncbi:hypothetical protein I4U23_017540 [Adineta vaga]|nr:hypothetical protein I4U23_017540 [Adineta vaga]
MQPLSTLDTTKPINFDDLNIIIRSLPPRRRQSGTSIIPFRPYVKRLTSVRQPFSFANGRDGWVTTGEREAFFKQENARCIGSLFSDCETSEVIRWDIEGESTRLPMMCKLWIIVDGAVVERGKPRMVQDAAVTVFLGGRTLLSLLSSSQYQVFNHTILTRYDRRRRHSWHDVNEYHSIPYFQYTSSINRGSLKFIQCDLDNEQYTGQVQSLPFIQEETADEHSTMEFEEHNAREMIHNHEVPQDRVQISMKTQTDNSMKTRSTSIDSGITSSSLYTVEITESIHSTSSRQSHNVAIGTHDDISYSNQSISTRDHINDTHHSIATGNDIQYSDQSIATHDGINYCDQAVATGDHIKYSNQSIATHDDIGYASQSVSTRDDIEYSDRSMSTYDDVKYSNQSVSTHDDVEYSDRSMSTYDDVHYANQAVATRDDIEYSDRSMSTYDDVSYAHQSVGTHDDVQHSHQSVSTRDHIEYVNQSVSTGDGIEYVNQSVSTHDDLHYSNQSCSTRDDIECLNQSVSTQDDIQHSHQSVSTRDHADFTHSSIATGNDIEYANQSVSTHDDLHYSHQSTGTRDDIGYINQSVSTADGISYSHQSVATRDDFEYLNQSVSTRDDIGYSHQSVATRDDFECLNQSVSTRDDLEYLNQSVSTQDEVQHSSRSIATGTDYPDFWLQFSTSEILSEYIIQPHEDRDSSILSPRQSEQLTRTETEHDTDIELERPRPSSSRSSRTPVSSSSVTISNDYQVIDQIDDENTTKESLPRISRRLDSPGDLESHYSYGQTETSSRNSARSRRVTSSSGYNSFDLAPSRRTYSTPDHDNYPPTEVISTNDITQTMTTPISQNPSSNLLQSLMERHERTVQDRRRTTAMINDELYDIGHIVQNYRERIRDPVTTQSNRAIQVKHDIVTASPKPREDRPSSPMSSTGSSRSRYRYISNITNDEMIPDYLPSSHLYSTSIPCKQTSTQPHYCEICFSDHSSGSAWIRYNEQRMERLQQRIDLMLELDDVEDGQYALSTLNSTATTTQRIDDILRGRSSYQNHMNYDHDDILSAYRYSYGSSYRAKSLNTNSPRLLSSRKMTRSASPASKRVRISTNHVLIPNQTRLREPVTSSKPVPRPIVSILRRNTPIITSPSPPPTTMTTTTTTTTATARSQRHRELSQTWRNDQWSIPRYYRLYNDVGFREVYDFSRFLDSCLTRTTPKDYSSILHHYALEQQFPSTIPSLA